MRNVLIATILLGLSQNVLAESTGPLYRQATVAFDSENWTEAAAKFKQVYQRDPTSPEAEDSLFFWGEALLQSNRFKDAKQCFDNYLRQWPEGRRARAARFRTAEALMLDRNYKEAKYLIQRFETLYPSDPLLEYTTTYLAEIALAEDDPDKAKRLYKKALKAYPKGSHATECRLELTRLQATQGDLEKSPTRKTLNENQTCKTISHTCETTEVPNKPPQATKIKADEPATPPPPHLQPTDVVAEDQPSPPDVAVLWRQACFFQQSGKLGPALVAYEDLYRKHPHTPEADQARAAAAKLYLQFQQPGKAKAIYDELLVRAGRENSKLSKPTLLFEAALTQEAIEKETGEAKPPAERDSTALLRQLLREYPQSPESVRAAYRLAHRAVDAGDFTTAQTYLEKSLDSKDTPTVARSLQLSWRMAAAEQNWNAVREAATRLLSLGEKETPAELNCLARFWLAETDYRTGQFKSAQHRFATLSRRIEGQDFPSAGLVSLRFAQTLAQLGDFAGARQTAEKAIAATPDFADRDEFDYLIGRCAFAQGEYNTARLAFGRVLQSQTATSTETKLLAQEAIAATLFAQKDYESAIVEFAKLQSDDAPASYRAKALHYTALCHERLGKKSKAETLYQRLVDRYPNYPLR